MSGRARPLRILVAHNVACERPGGMNRIMRFTHEHLAARGHAVEYLCAEDLAPRASGFMARFAFPRLVRSRVRSAERAGRPYDVVNVHEPSGALVAGRATAVVVVTTHGIEQRAWELARTEARLGRTPLALRSRLVYPVTVLRQARRALRRADHVFCLNEEDRAYLTDRMGVRNEAITRIIPGAHAVHAIAAATRDYARGDRVVFAGTWRPHKGIGDLVAAFTVLADRYPGLTLTVLGPGVPDVAVRDAFPASLRDRVLPVASSGDDDTARVLGACDAFLLPSLFEGTPLTLMEAMASGLPIVTTDTCGMRDVIRHEANGLLVAVRSPEEIVCAVDRLMTDPQLRARLGRAAHADWARYYTWPIVARPIGDVYERLARSAE